MKAIMREREVLSAATEFSGEINTTNTHKAIEMKEANVSSRDINREG